MVKIGTTQAQRKLFFSLNKERKLLESQGYKPDTKLLAERLQVKESEVIEMSQRMDNWDVSLESPVREDSSDEQKDRITSYNVCYTKLLRDVVVVADLVYSKVSKRPTRWVVAVPGDSNIEKLEDLEGKKIATELVSYNFV